MRIFLLGATGSIGSAVLRELLSAGHHVTALCRSDTAAKAVSDQGAAVQRGDMRQPEEWSEALKGQDVVIHAAITFDDEMVAADRIVVDTILSAANHRSTPLRVVYTGGCWLYGDTQGRIATENDGFAPLLAFRAMLDHAHLLMNAPALVTATLHPAMVYHEEGGVFDGMLADIKANRPVEIWGSRDIRWPLIHRTDLAIAYRLLAERPDLTGHFNAVAQTGVTIGEIAATLSRTHHHDGRQTCLPRMAVLAREGHWAEGPMLDQRLSSARLMQATGWSPRYNTLEQTFPPV